MVTVSLVLQIAALVVFVLAACNVASPRVSLVPLGLALWVGSLLVGAIR